MEFIKDISTYNTGGGCMNDIIHLKDGTVLVISDDCIGLYANIAEYDNGEHLDTIEREL